MEEHNTILVVDDEEMVLDVAMQMLETLGYRVMAAKSGAEALRVYELNRAVIKLVILDVLMPGMNGSQVYTQLKDDDPDIKVLFLSGYGADQVPEEVTQGSEGFLQKPFNVQELAQKVGKVMGGSRN